MKTLFLIIFSLLSNREEAWKERYKFNKFHISHSRLSRPDGSGRRIEGL